MAQARIKLERVREFQHLSGENHVEYYLAPSKKFKSAVLRAVFTLPMSAKTAAMAALLPHVLRRATQASPNLALLSQRCEDLYGTTIKAESRKLGRRQLVSITLKAPSPRYLPGGMREFGRVLDLLYEVLCEPLVVDKAFHPAIFESEREQLLHDIAGQIDARSEYAIRQAVEKSFAKGSPYGMRDYGSASDVKKVSNQHTYRFYRRTLKSAHLAFYATGDFTASALARALTKRFGLLERVKAPLLPLNRPAPKRQQVSRSSARHQIEQAFVVLTHTTGANIAHKRFPALLYADAVMGRLSSSRLFRRVREEEGLAYNVASFVSPLTGLSVAYAGVDPENLARTSKLMRDEIALLKKEGASNEEFEAARHSVIEDYLVEQDSPGAAISSLMTQQSCGRIHAAKEERIALEGVGPKDVLAALKHFNLSAEYRLSP